MAHTSQARGTLDLSGVAVLVDLGDDEGLLAALRRMVQDPGLRQRLGEAGRRRVETAFSVGSMTTGNLSIYREVMKRNHGRNRH